MAGSALPYFDRILQRLADGDEEVTLAFGRNVRWGCWDDPTQADGTLADFARAAGRLGERVCSAAGVRDGQRILDVACGFGGTLSDLNDCLNAVELHGLNIDPRQLARARSLLEARPGNRIHLVAGDACRLPFADAAFDAVVCVEAIFHFADRGAFLGEVRRVLRPGGRFAFSDFVPRLVIPWLWDRFDRRFKPVVNRLYGQNDMRCTVTDYRRLAQIAGLRVARVQDITWRTMPTYRVVRPLVRRIAADPDEAEDVIRRVELASRMGLLRYLVLTLTPVIDHRRGQRG